jgi:hypothetical protein
MKIPDNYSITLRVNNELVKLNLKKEFSLTQDSLEESPPILGYLVGLQSEVLTALNKSRLARDRYYARQWLIIKDDDGPFQGRPPSDEHCKQEIMDDEVYIDLRVKYEKEKEYYELVTNLIDTYKIRIEVLRTLAANRRKETQL